MITRMGGAAALLVLLSFGACASIETVEQGHEAVATRFGKVTGQVLGPGFHFVNPILAWDHFSTLQREFTFEGITVPAADQMKATMDITVQFRISPGAPLQLRKETGVQADAYRVHFTPVVREAFRDAGRGTAKVEDFYNEATIERYSQTALESIRTRVVPKGFEVTSVLVRDVSLPEIIARAIDQKKQREQEVEKERAELARVELEAQQQVKQADAQREAQVLQATARRDAAVLDAEAKKTLADAEAYKIRRLQEQLIKSPNYIELIKAERWNGAVPRISSGQGGGMGFLLDLGQSMN